MLSLLLQMSSFVKMDDAEILMRATWLRQEVFFSKVLMWNSFMFWQIYWASLDLNVCMNPAAGLQPNIELYTETKSKTSQEDYSSTELRNNFMFVQND